MDRSDRRTLAITAILAVGAPIGAAWWIASRTDELASRLADAGGVPARIGNVDADLSGAVRLSDVAFGDLVSADAVEASVGVGSLLDGQLRADEIRVEGPHVALAIDPDGDSDLARLARRLQGRKRHAASGAASRRGSSHHAIAGPVRRIVVSDGTLVARIAGIGEITADRVELFPEATGTRVLTGPLRVRAAHRRVDLDVGFARSAAEITPRMTFGRMLAVGGDGSVTVGRAKLALHDLAAGRRAAHGPLEVRAMTDDNGVPRTAGLTLTPDFGVELHGDRFPLRALAPLAPHGLDVTDTHVTGSVMLRRGAAGLRVVAAGTVDHLVVTDRRIAGEAVPVSFGVRADAKLSADAIEVPFARFRLEGADQPPIAITTVGWIRRGSPVSGELEVEIPTAPCQALLAAVPDPIRGPLDGMALSGVLGARAHLAVDLAAPDGKGATLTNRFLGGCRVAAEPPAADVMTLARVSEQQLADGSRKTIGPGEPGWVKLKGVPWYVPGAFVSAEDARFWSHPGFDLKQIARSLEIDLREDRLARGGSTISQQLIKNAFLSQRRSFDRKLQEAILTWRLEDRLGKKQILERYLNIIELGPRVWGIHAAAHYWFDLSPRELTVAQAAFLAALTSQPTSMARRIRHAGGVDAQTAERLGIVLGAMRRDGTIDDEAYRKAKKAHLHFSRRALGR